MQIKVESNPPETRLKELGVRDWPVWTKEVSVFPWFYDDPEVCYFLEGEVEVIHDGAPPVKIHKGDLVTFPLGMNCIWKVLKPVKKHYRFG